jgi:phage-related baseplate assembly protein
VLGRVDLVRLEGAAVLPVAEADTLLAGDTAEVINEAKEDETSEGQNLDEREPEPVYCVSYYSVTRGSVEKQKRNNVYVWL